MSEFFFACSIVLLDMSNTQRRIKERVIQGWQLTLGSNVNNYNIALVGRSRSAIYLWGPLAERKH